MFTTINPADESVIERYPLTSSAAVDAALDAAVRAWSSWGLGPLEPRVGLLRRLAEALRSRRDPLSRLITAEMGKPVREARAELDKCAATCLWYADHAAQLLAPRAIEVPDGAAQVIAEPLGPLLAIMPWNFPFWQVIRCAAPAVALGNPVLLKHAPNTTGCALACAELFAAAGAPEGVFATLVVEVDQVEGLIADPRVAAVTLTGSERAGSAVAAAAGRAIKPVVLELGGSDPFIVLADADVDRALEVAVQARMMNSGQSCIAAKRIIVEAPLYDRFVRRFAERVEALVCDDPAFESTQVGPLARRDLLEQFEQQVEATIGWGARCVTGGGRGRHPGFFFTPTVLAEVPERAPAAREELFGPAAALWLAHDAEHALALANDTSFGLGAALWTRPERAPELTRALRAGFVAVNGMVRSDARVPFGGIRRSGVGRELGSEGLMAFANLKTVWTS
mgnify:CR=1 FL=1